MSEAKRATLATIGDVDREKKAANTVRVELKLFEPNATTFPEFNFQALLHAEKKKRKKISKLNGFTPTDAFENDDDVARIAKELEKKYGCNSAYGKKERAKVAGEYCDKGAGYDENDSFIDNTEAYDELIPDEVETVRGGFYINSGPLEFQHLSNYERPEDAQRMPKPKKRALSTSSSSSDEEVEETKAQASVEGQKNGHQEKKLKTVSVDESKKVGKVVKVTPSGDKSRDQKVKTDERALKTTTVKDMLRAKRDAALKTSPDDLSSAPMTSESSNESTAIEMPNGTGGLKPETKLPQNLSEDLLRNILLLKESARVSASMGKANFFDSKVQEILLRIENATRTAGGHVRNQVYSHLEAHLPCSKQTLMLRAKKLRIQQEEAKVRRAVARLRKSVEEGMPGIQEAYEKEYERIMQLKSSMAIMGIPEKENDLKWPRKQYAWSDATRGLLNAVVSACRSAFGTIKSRKETVEDYVLDCLKMDVLPIWPASWMKLEGVLKELEWKIDMKNVNKVPAAQPVAAKVDPKPPPATFPGNSSLTITPVSATAPTSKPLPSVQNKVTITNVEGGVKAPSVPAQLPSGLSISITSSPTPPPAPTVTPNVTQLKTASKSPPKEATPPPKKSFDYSISSIISSTTQSTTEPTTVVTAAPAVTIEPEKVPPVIEVEEKAKSPAPAALNPIKVRSVANVNSSVDTPKDEKVPKIDVIFEDLSSTTTESDSDTDSSSDCEIIESTQDVKRKTGATSKTVQRPPKTVPIPTTSSGAQVVQLSRDLDPLALGNDNDIDVNQIMKELKELQEFQQNNPRAPSGFNNKKSSDISEYSIGTLDAAKISKLPRNSHIQPANHHPHQQDEKPFHEVTKETTTKKKQVTRVEGERVKGGEKKAKKNA